MDERGSAVSPPDVVDAFTSATITALQELTQVEVFPDALSSVATESCEPLVSATIRLLRSKAGAMSLTLTAATAARLAGRYLPDGTTLTEEMIDDVAGEFANVIAGQAKTILKGTVYHFNLSTPIVVRGASFAQLPEESQSTLIAVLSCELGLIQLRANLLADASEASAHA